ncbi:hypothetical protein SEUCBS140593_009072 [Sporothrix eucalyptigena]|uniref:Uncharacterized protein n=1 Tax=Sporothrix eucalyptigena TaxID=1812306 RepID=A0ABP0CV22_9PEZI
MPELEQNVPYTTSLPLQLHSHAAQRLYTDPTAAVNTDNDISYAADNVPVAISPRTQSTQRSKYPLIMPRPEPTPAGQQLSTAPKAHQTQVLRRLAPAPRVSQWTQPTGAEQQPTYTRQTEQDIQPASSHEIGRSVYGQSSQGSHALHGHSGHHGSHWQHGQPGQHIESMDYSQQAAENYTKVPWQVDTVSHQANILSASAGTRHYDPVSTMEPEATEAGYYTTSFDEYTAPHDTYQSQ